MINYSPVQSTRTVQLSLEKVFLAQMILRLVVVSCFFPLCCHCPRHRHRRRRRANCFSLQSGKNWRNEKNGDEEMRWRPRRDASSEGTKKKRNQWTICREARGWRSLKMAVWCRGESHSIKSRRWKRKGRGRNQRTNDRTNEKKKKQRFIIFLSSICNQRREMLDVARFCSSLLVYGCMFEGYC